MAKRPQALPKAVRDLFARFGATGGKTRAARLTEEERRESARKAVEVRWERYREAQQKRSKTPSRRAKSRRRG